jgi:NitT/TauT family transport system permease protein
VTSSRSDAQGGLAVNSSPADVQAQPLGDKAGTATPDSNPRRWRTSGAAVLVAQVLLVAVVLAAWEYVPKIHGISAKSHFLDPYFISSPSLIYAELGHAITGSDGVPSIWPYVWPTFEGSLLGTVIGLALGGVLGLILGSYRFIGRVFRPFVTVLNAVPRIALIPIIVVIMGSGLASSTVIAVAVVLFVGLFNAYEGAHNVERHILDNVRLLGASGWHVMWRVRFPYALAWTLASLPIAVSFAIVSVVTGEILIGGGGLGYLMSEAALQADASLTFAVIVFLAVFALIILGLAELFKRRALHWWSVNSDT